jgi:8-oxo-dGTP pyrophosphatase MutT (NUDIX family)
VLNEDAYWKTPPGRRIGALALFRTTQGAVLLVKPSYTPNWNLPGGGANGRETVIDACRREVREETGLTDVAPGSLLIVDYIPFNPQTGNAEGYNFVFDGGFLDADVRITLPPPDEKGEAPEITAHKWVPADDLARYVTHGLYRRIAASLNVLRDPRAPRFLIRGYPARP